MKKLFLIVSMFTLLSSCKDFWEDSDKDSFRQGCMDVASKSRWTGGNDTIAKAYCECVLDKMTKKYPFYNDAMEHMGDLMKDTDLIKCKEETLKQFHK